MKITILMLLAMIGSSSFAQKVSGTSQSWAGGICCSSGTNYTITIVFPDEIDAKCVDIDSLHLEGNVFCGDSWRAQLTDSTITLSFSKSYHRYDNYIDPELITNPAKKRVISDESIYYRHKRKSYTLAITNMLELPYLAYP